MADLDQRHAVEKQFGVVAMDAAAETVCLCDAGPAFGRQIAGAVGQHIRGVVHAETDRDDADIVGALIFVAAGARRVDRYDDALEITRHVLRQAAGWPKKMPSAFSC